MPALRSFLNLGEDITRKLRLPEFNISETLRGKLDPGMRFTRGVSQENTQGVAESGIVNPNLFSGAAVPTSGAFEGPQQLGPTGQSAGGITGAQSNVGAAGVETPGALTTSTEAEAARVQSGIESEIGKLPSTFSDIFAPIIEDLDAQLGALPGQQEFQEGRATSGAEARGRLVGSERERLLTGLGASEEKVRGESKKTLRGIGESIGQQFKAANAFLGTKGAGDSSATGRASEAITKAGLRQQGLAKEQLQTQVADIETRRIDVQQIAEGKLQEIEANKQDRLAEIVNSFQSIARQLNTQKATANSQELAGIAQQESVLQQEMRDQLGRLGQETRDAQQATEDWNRDRNAELQDFAARLATSGTFTGGAQFSAEQGRLLDQAQTTLDNIVASGVSVEEAYNRLESVYGADLRNWIFPSQGDKEDPIDALINNALSGASGGGGEPGLLGKIGNVLSPGQPFGGGGG